MKNIRKFNTTAAMDAAVLTEPYVLYNEETGLVYTNHNGSSSDNEVDYSTMYTTFEALEDGTFSFTKNGAGNDIQYSKDNGSTWTSLVSGESVSVVTGDKVMWKSNITPSSSGIGTFSSNINFNAYGNTMSLLYGDGFKGQTSLEGKDNVFYKLFNESDYLIDASNLILPATTLAYGCYNNMFSGCASLTTAPELPATTLADSCYKYMFDDCTNLTTAPELPATKATQYCYTGMFSGCASLTTAPELPATTLADSCYYYMFYKCTSLTTAPELPATTLAEYCYSSMFNSCSSLNHITMLATDKSANQCLVKWVNKVSSTGTFVKHPEMTSLPNGVSGIPEGWTVVDYQG